MLIKIHIIVSLVWLLGYTKLSFCAIHSIPLPAALSECLQKRTRGLRPSDYPGHSISSYCLKTFKIRELDMDKLKLDIPQETLNWVGALLREFYGEIYSHRTKRQTLPRRVRKEIRLLTEHERNAFLKAVSDLKSDTSIFPNKYDAIARIHSGNFTIDSAHDSSNFFGWHRIYLIVFEQALREKNPSVTLPYWDSTMDFDMEEPTDSVIWSSAFMGNGDGVVTSGTFGNWITGDNIPLIRNIGSTGSLLSKPILEDIFTRTYHYEINEGTAEVRYSLEGHHDDVHRWIDGQMGGLHTSPQDPIFFLHHGFIDYIWHHFRIRQKLNGIDPYADYPPTNITLHEPYRPMAGFAPLRNIDGYSNFWDDILQYEDSATCSNGCGSIYLHCVRGRCVSKDRSFLNGAINQNRRLYGHKQMSLSKQKALALGPLPIGKQFKYYSTDMRTRNDSMPVRARTRTTEYQGPIPFGKVLKKMVTRWNSVHEKSGKYGQSSSISNFDKTKRIGVGMTPGQSANPSFQNTFLINNNADVNKWVFIPVQVLYKKPSYTNHGSKNAYHTQNKHTGIPKGYNKCRNRNTGKEKVSVHSVGINYMGAYTGFADFKLSSGISSSVTYVAVQNPENGVSKAIISAYDSCGRMCIPTCLIHGSNPPAFKPCSGAIEVTGNTPKMFSNPELNHKVQYRYYEIPVSSRSNIAYLSFNCFYKNSWPWLNCN